MKRKLSALILIVLSIFLSDDLFADPMFGKKKIKNEQLPVKIK